MDTINEKMFPSLLAIHKKHFLLTKARVSAINKIYRSSLKRVGDIDQALMATHRQMKGDILAWKRTDLWDTIKKALKSRRRFSPAALAAELTPRILERDPVLQKHITQLLKNAKA